MDQAKLEARLQELPLYTYGFYDTAELTFTDAEGRVFRYALSSFETLGPNDVARLVSGDWDLTLFTCNTSGQTRCVIRCDRIP